MGSPTRGAWVCRHGTDGRDFCPECYGPPEIALSSPEVPEIDPRVREIFDETIAEHPAWRQRGLDPDDTGEPDELG
jgi:hypothetical protein